MIKGAGHGEIQAVGHFLRLTFLRPIIIKGRKCSKYTCFNSKEGKKNIHQEGLITNWVIFLGFYHYRNFDIFI